MSNASSTQERSREYGGSEQRLVRFEEEHRRAAEAADAPALEEEDFVAGSLWPTYGELGKLESPRRLRAACDRVYTQYARDCDDRRRRGGKPIDTLEGIALSAPIEPELTESVVDSVTPEASAEEQALPQAPTAEASTASIGTDKRGREVFARTVPFASKVTFALRNSKLGLSIREVAARVGITVPEARKTLLDLMSEGRVNTNNGSLWELEAL